MNVLEREKSPAPAGTQTLVCPSFSLDTIPTTLPPAPSKVVVISHSVTATMFGAKYTLCNFCRPTPYAGL
jgi:hypothetical protein